MRVTIKGGYNGKAVSGLSFDIPVTIGNAPGNSGSIPLAGPAHSFYAVNQSPFPLPPTVAQGGFPVVAPQMYPSSPSLPEPDIEVGEKATSKVLLQDMQNIPPPTHEEALKSWAMYPHVICHLVLVLF